MSTIGKNIKKIRSLKNLSQSAFAEIFGLTRASVSSYEEGRAKPKSAKVIEIANYFSIPMEDLLTKEITVNQLMHFNLDKLATSDTANTKTAKKAPITHAGFNEIPYISIKQQTDFLQHYQKREFIDSLPNLRLAFHESRNLFAFEQDSQAMQNAFGGIAMGDILIAEELNSLNEIINGEVVLFQTQSEIVCGFTHLQNNAIELSFLNNSATTLAMSEIIMAYRIIQLISQNPIQQLNLQGQLQTLENRLKNLEK